MISIIKIEPQSDYNLKLFFSDETFGIINFSYILEKKSVLTKALEDRDYFKSCFIDFGALCWKNGLELSAESLYRKCKENNALHVNQASA